MLNKLDESGNGLLSSNVIITLGSEEIISPSISSRPSNVMLKVGLMESRAIKNLFEVILL